MLKKLFCWFINLFDSKKNTFPIVTNKVEFAKKYTTQWSMVCFAVAELSRLQIKRFSVGQVFYFLDGLVSIKNVGKYLSKLAKKGVIVPIIRISPIDNKQKNYYSLAKDLHLFNDNNEKKT